MKKLIASVMLVLSATAVAETYCFLKFAEGSNDWTDPKNYYTDWSFSSPKGALPADGDRILLQANVEYKLDADDTKSCEFVNKMRRITLQIGTTLEIAVGEGKELTLKPFVETYYDTEMLPMKGTIAKTGAGAQKTTYAAVNAIKPYGMYSPICASVDVREGSFYMPQSGMPSGGQCYVGRVTVRKGAAFYIARDDANLVRTWCHEIITEPGSVLGSESQRSSSVTFGSYGFVSSKDLTSDGVKDKPAHVEPTPHSVINGAMTGNFYFYTYDDIEVTSKDNKSFAGSNYATVAGGGTLITPQFGADRWVTSGIGLNGAGGWNYGAYGSVLAFCLGMGTKGTSATVLYKGEGESTFAGFVPLAQLPKADGSSAEAMVIDAGAVGGVTFCHDEKDNAFFLKPQSSWMVKTGHYSCPRVVLTGDNAKEMVVQGGVFALKDGDTEYPMYINKTGKGTWTFDNGDCNYHSGVTQVSDGTLKFTSIAPAGEMCALGLSNNLRPDSSLAVDYEEWVDYAFLLGDRSGEGEPVFEYAGETSASVWDRPLALAGNGGTLRASAGALDLSDIRAADSGTAPVLKLDGAGEDNIAREIRDGADGAKVSVEKNGEGTWTLAGNQTFSGDVRVNAGRLALKIPQHEVEKEPFRWYRLNIAKIGDGENRFTISMRQICLYDAEGNRINTGLKVASGNDAGGNYVAACTPAAGECAWDAAMAGHHIGGSGLASLAGAFDGIYSGEGGKLQINSNYDSSGKNPCYADPDDPTTWVRIVMHLAEGKGPATHFDLQGLGSSQLNNLPTQFSLEGSIDGQKWTEVYSNIYAYDADWTTSEQYNFWLSDTTKTGDAHATLAYDEGYFYNLSETGALPFEAYKWFRLSFAQIGTPPDYTYHGISLRQIGLYSEDGARQNVGLKVVNGITSTGGIVQSALIGKGEAGYDASMAGTRITFDSGYSDISGSFIEDGYSGDKGKCIFRHLTSDYKNIVPDPYDESTWISVIMHLKDEAKPITHFDVETLDWNNKSVPTRVRLEASLDGMTWDEVWSNVDDGYEPIDWGEEGVRYNRWMSDPTKVAAAHATLPYSADNPLNTWSTGVEKGADEDWFDQFYYTEGFGVANGATLAATAPFDLDRLVVDASKTNGGTLEGFNIVQGGQITVRNLPQMGAVIDLPMLGEGCTGEGFEDWNVVGADPEKYSVLIKNGQLKINSNQSGMVILIK